MNAVVYALTELLKFTERRGSRATITVADIRRLLNRLEASQNCEAQDEIDPMDAGQS